MVTCWNNQEAIREWGKPYLIEKINDSFHFVCIQSYNTPDLSRPFEQMCPYDACVDYSSWKFNQLLKHDIFFLILFLLIIIFLFWFLNRGKK